MRELEADFEWKQGDREPTLDMTCEDAVGVAKDIQGAGVRFLMRTVKSATAAPKVAVAATNLQNGDGSDGSRGKVRFSPLSVDTDTPGDYVGEFEVTYASGKPETFPNLDHLLIRITPQIG